MGYFKLNWFVCVICLCLLCHITIQAATDRLYQFTNYTSENSELPYNMVTSITQDKKGYIWFGTSSGLSRFDGRKFRNYTKKDLGLESSYIISLCCDDDGKLWIGTDLGVSVYNEHMDCFKPFTMKSNIGTFIHSKVNTICKGPDGDIWISVNSQGLFCLSKKDNKLYNYYFENNKQTLPINIRSLYVDNDNDIWISLFYHSLFYVSTKDKTSENLSFKKAISSFKNDDIKAINSIKNNCDIIYVASVSKGLCSINKKDNTIKVLIPTSFCDYTPESLFADNSGKVWMSTNKGVIIYDSNTGKIDRLSKQNKDIFSLSDDHTFCTFIDSSKGIWIGTNIGGVSYCGHYQQNFKKLYLIDNQAIGNCLVRGFTEDNKNNIWIATENKGLLMYDIANNRLNTFNNNNIPKTLFSICYDNDCLWIGSQNGLYKLNIKTNKTEQYDLYSFKENIKDKRVFTIYKVTAGDVYVGTTVGLSKYNRFTNKFESIKEFNGIFVTDIDEGEDGMLWVSTYAHGLMNYSLLKKRIIHNYRYAQDSMYNNRIHLNKLFSVCVSNDNTVWMTSFGGGFYSFDVKNRKFKIYDTEHYDCLKTNIYFQVLEDTQDKIWITSDKGLISLNPETDDMQHYSIYDGILDNDFKNCGLVTQNGDIYLGSRSGFICFNPGKFIKERCNPQLVINDFRIGNNLIIPSQEKRAILKRNIDESDEIQLPPNVSSFGFGFSILKTSSPKLNKIMCMLEGFDKDWHEVPDDNVMYYYNIPSGKYILNVKSIDSDGDTILTHNPIKIEITQYFYKTFIAIIIYILLLISLVAFSFTIYHRRTMKREKRKHEEYKLKKDMELFSQRLTFFSNILHEIKTPLTVMSAPLHNIMASLNLKQQDKENLNIINNSTIYLNKLVKELLDFVSIGKDKFTLNCKKLNIVEITSFLCSNFSETAKAKNIRISFNSVRQNIFIFADEAAISKVLNNLLDNAIKYAESYVEINLTLEDEKVIIKVCNDGPEIEPQNRMEVFKPFVKHSNTESENSQSYGIGLTLARTLTELHNGSLTLSDKMSPTTFLLSLPILSQVQDEVINQNNSIENNSLPVILLVEDNYDLSSYLIGQLQNDYKIIAVHSAEEGINELQKGKIDIIITDIILSGMSGLDFCSKLAESEKFSKIPKIVTSAISSVNTKIACIEAGVSIYLEKPYSIEYLKVNIKNILDKKAQQEAETKLHKNELDTSKLKIVSADEEFILHLNEVIMKNIKDPFFSSKQIEDALFISRSTLIRKIKQLLDTTPNNYIRSKRLSIAAQLLSEKKYRVSDVCFAVGFNSPSYFAKCFKEEFGILPAEYIKKEDK